MQRLGRMLLMLTVLTLVPPALALPEAAHDDESHHNQTLLRRWQSDPEHYARLKRHLKAFKALPAARQDRLRQLDRELHDEEPATQARLWRVMDRYSAWFDRLPTSDRERIAAATDARQRLQIVREVRERQWVERLPLAKRQQVVNAESPEKRAATIARFRKEEQERRFAWQKVASPRDDGSRRGPIVRVTDLPEELRLFVEGKLLPVLAVDDRKKLEESEGKWPLFGTVLRDLLEKYPLTFPAPPDNPVLVSKDLPAAVRMKFQQIKGAERKRISDATGKWPEFAIAVTDAIRRLSPPMPEELGPCRPGQFSRAQHEFIEKKLIPALSNEEQAELRKAEGLWPDYPQTVLKLSLKHRLSVPELPLPEPQEFWERLRIATTDVPLKWLQDFARDELSPQERAQLKLKYDDPESLFRLKELYLQRKPRSMWNVGSKDRPRPRKDTGSR